MQAIDLETSFYRLLQMCGDKINCRMEVEDLSIYGKVVSSYGFELANQAVSDIYEDLDDTPDGAFPSVQSIISRISELKRSL